VDLVTYRSQGASPDPTLAIFFWKKNGYFRNF
jgi:hypothetical protein